MTRCLYCGKPATGAHQAYAAHPDICIISFSIHDHVEPLMHGAGADACLTKDTSLDELLALIRACYQRRSASKPLSSAA